MKKVCYLDKFYVSAMNRLIADQALPVELRQSQCSPSCSEDCLDKLKFEVWTWIPERQEEIRMIIVDQLVNYHKDD